MQRCRAFAILSLRHAWVLLALLACASCQNSDRILAVTVELENNGDAPPVKTIELTMRSTSAPAKSVLFTGTPRINLPAVFALYVTPTVRGQLTLSAVVHSDETPEQVFRGTATVRLTDAAPDKVFKVRLPVNATAP